MTREMCSARLVFSTSKKMARRPDGSGRAGSGAGTRAASAGSGMLRGSPSSGCSMPSSTSETDDASMTGGGASGSACGRARPRRLPERLGFRPVATIPPRALDGPSPSVYEPRGACACLNHAGPPPSRSVLKVTE